MADAAGKYDEPDDVSIPVIEIVPGWAADSMTSVEDCEDAHIKCMALCAEIEFQIDMFETKPQIERDYTWLARAKRALKYKKLAAQIVNSQRSRMNQASKQARAASYDARLLAYIREHADPDSWSKWLKAVPLVKEEDADA